MSLRILFISILFYFIGVHVIAQDLLKPLDGNWKFRLGDDFEWAKENFDHSDWDAIYAPSAWENEGFNGYDGYAWYRKEFSGERLKDKYNLILNLGYIDDTDQVYLNGQLIGYSGQFPPDFHTAYNALRVYNIPDGLIHDGNNTIAIRVYDTVLGGGIISGNIGVYTYDNDKNYGGMVLEGLWKFQEGDDIEWKENSYDDADWAYLVAPGLWKYLGKKNFDSFGWYRKKIELPSRIQEGELTLVLGKIDDFDEVFFNGKLIGSTNDGRSYGFSRSYESLRVYSIPNEYVNRDGKNLIAVRVMDMGGEAGIYKGPLLLIKSRYAANFVREYYDR